MGINYNDYNIERFSDNNPYAFRLQSDRYIIQNLQEITERSHNEQQEHYERLLVNPSGQFVHYLSHERTEFSTSAFEEIQNPSLYDGEVKPYGGFWGSPVDKDSYSWKDFCHEEDFRVCTEDKAVYFTFKPDARVLEITDSEDSIHLPWIVDSRQVSFINDNFRMEQITVFDAKLDFEKMREDGISAIIITDPETTPEVVSINPLQNYDCSSVIVLDPYSVDIDYERSLDPQYHEYYKESVGERIEIENILNRKGVIIDNTNRTVVDFKGTPDYNNPNDRLATARYTLDTPEIHCTIDGYGNIVLPDGNIKLDPDGAPDESARIEIEYFASYWRDQLDEGEEPEIDKDIFSITRQEEGPPLDRSHLCDKIFEPDKFNKYTVVSCGTDDFNRNILFLKNDNGSIFKLDADKRDGLIKISQEEYSKNTNEYAIVLPNHEMNIYLEKFHTEMGYIPSFETKDIKLDHNDFSYRGPLVINEKSFTPQIEKTAEMQKFRIEGYAFNSLCVSSCDTGERYLIERSSYGAVDCLRGVSEFHSDIDTKTFYHDDLGLIHPPCFSPIEFYPNSHDSYIELPLTENNEILISKDIETPYFSWNQGEKIAFKEEMFHQYDPERDHPKESFTLIVHGESQDSYIYYNEDHAECCRDFIEFGYDYGPANDYDYDFDDDSDRDYEMDAPDL